VVAVLVAEPLMARWRHDCWRVLKRRHRSTGTIGYQINPPGFTVACGGDNLLVACETCNQLDRDEALLQAALDERAILSAPAYYAHKAGQ
jgi:hypothetical protein